MNQCSLFGNEEVQACVPGLVYQPEFLSRDEEQEFIAIIRSLPLHAARYKAYFARRRVVSFGASYDFDTHELKPARCPCASVSPPGARGTCWWPSTRPARRWAGTGTCRISSGFSGVSLGGEATLKFRPFPYVPDMQRQVVDLAVQPRSVYMLAGDARWKWQHCIEPTRELRWSITFRDFQAFA